MKQGKVAKFPLHIHQNHVFTPNLKNEVQNSPFFWGKFKRVKFPLNLPSFFWNKFPLHVHKNHLNFYYELSFVENERDYVKTFEHCIPWWDGGVVVSTLVSYMDSPGFDSRWLQILLTSFLLCAKFCPKQISPACTKKLRQHSYCAKFCSKWIGIMFKNLSSSIYDEMVV